MTVLGSLAVNVLARIKGFGRNEQLGKAQARLKSFTTNIKNTAASLKSFAAIAGAVATAAVGRFVVKEFEAIEALGLKAQLLGVNIQKLQALSFAARTSGVEENTLTTAMQRFARRTAEAAKGSGEAQAAIRELGLDARTLVRLPIAERFELILERLAKIPDASERVRLAFKFFDSEGVKIANMATGLREAVKEYQNFGKATTGEDFKKAQQFNREMAMLLEKLKLQGRSLLIEAGPTLINLLEALNAAVKVGQDSGLFSVAGAALKANPLALIGGINRRAQERLSQSGNLPAITAAELAVAGGIRKAATDTRGF